MPTFAIARKDLRLLLRDPRSVVVLVVMPLLLMLLLGLTLGRAFGEKPDSKIRITVVVEDAGLPPDPARDFPPKPWSDILLDDLADTANIRVELVSTRAEAERLVRRGERSAVVVLTQTFSDRCQHCSFVGPDFKSAPVNPLFRDGVRTDELGVEFITNPSQPVGSSVIQQVVQVSLLRVVIPWMIGQAFDLIGTDKFMAKMEGKIPALGMANLVPGLGRAKLGDGIRRGIADFFSEYDFNAKTWAGLTEAKRKHGPITPAAGRRPDNRTVYADPAATQYQTLVPGAVVTFAFFLVLSVGWLFVAERRHGTLVRLRLAPIGRTAILAGKLVPALLVSLAQGLFPARVWQTAVWHVLGGGPVAACAGRRLYLVRRSRPVDAGRWSGPDRNAGRCLWHSGRGCAGRPERIDAAAGIAPRKCPPGGFIDAACLGA